MVLVIDTSSGCSALALLDGGRPVGEDVVEAARADDLARRAAALAEPRRISAVAVALGPGSFTGTRTGVSYGVGLAMGLAVPLLGLDSLELAAARGREPATGLTEAGRGRLYFQAGGRAGHGEPAEIPRDRPATGWLRQAILQALDAAGVPLLDGPRLRSFGEAAAEVVGRAEKVGYDTVRLAYMSSFGPLRG